jgi:hypothetical protein
VAAQGVRAAADPAIERLTLEQSLMSSEWIAVQPYAMALAERTPANYKSSAMLGTSETMAPPWPYDNVHPNDATFHLRIIVLSMALLKES